MRCRVMPKCVTNRHNNLFTCILFVVAELQFLWNIPHVNIETLYGAEPKNFLKYLNMKVHYILTLSF
ncbi:hypothetical protein GDO78_015084 [Eleutherodactylus coqui]|uniref:Uncharacterized protein n=1 Tax=Eleutherodactylus coqui TaxID=57060 RepID=A0A8J6EDY7_ELECQ|nr:hypothetical protein GDO78_015084 [Eleutherodactylus coqui]